ncbi:putative tetrahydrofolate synthase [Microsporum canis]
MHDIKPDYVNLPPHIRHFEYVKSLPKAGEMERYEEAVRCLNSRRARAKPKLDDMRGSDDMVEWLQLLGHTVEDLNGLNIIHVAGTKGKGSTCAFVASFLKAHGDKTGFPRKVGLYTSPHIDNIRERIRINGEPISQDIFTSRFFEVWEKLPGKATDLLDIPRYLQLLALLSVHVFVTEKVDAAIYETHLGGEFDATNIISAPIATAITPISMDHSHLLGPTIEDIAWHKAGIFKSGSLAFSAAQEPAVEAVLRQRAAERGAALRFISLNSELPADAVALRPRVQKLNCSLALAVLRAWLTVKLPEQSSIDDVILNGIEKFSWPGRYQQINDGNYRWFLDGAHTDSSLCYAVEWFAERTRESQEWVYSQSKAYGSYNYMLTRITSIPTRILIFSHFSNRDGIALLRSIARSLLDNDIQVQHVILTSYDEMRDGRTRIDRNLTNRFSRAVQESYAEFWRSFDATATVSCERTIEEALHRARAMGDQESGMQALVTGSLHLEQVTTAPSLDARDTASDEAQQVQDHRLAANNGERCSSLQLRAS